MWGGDWSKWRGRRWRGSEEGRESRSGRKNEKHYFQHAQVFLCVGSGEWGGVGGGGGSRGEDGGGEDMKAQSRTIIDDGVRHMAEGGDENEGRRA